LYDPTRGSVRVWLLQYAYHRSLRRKDTLSRRAAYRGEPLDEVEALAHCPHKELTRDECRWVIRAGLAQLPDRQRTTLELTCFEELSLRDVAERLRVSLGCARHYYYRGLARLRAWAMTGQQCRPQQSAPSALQEQVGHQ
jgi:RNA polymerase sigma-70 factor (ECF subfamily)